MKPFLSTSNKLVYFLALLIFCFSIFSHFFRLSTAPLGMSTDEVAINYNAWGIATNGTDEWGHPYPISFQSYGDYKSPLVIYILALIYKVFGISEHALRYLTATFNLVFLLSLFFLTKHFIKPLNARLFLFLLAAITPWSLNLSRAGFEATIALFLVTTAVLVCKKNLYISSILFAISLYSYHSPKIVVPLILIYLFFIFRSHFYKPLAIFIFLSAPLIIDSIFSKSNSRIQTLIFNSPNFFSFFTKNLISHLDWRFWIGGVDAIGLRHSVPYFGVLFLPVLVLFILGIIVSIKKHQQKLIFLIYWFIVGLIPSIISIDNPHVVRSLLALPPILILATYGMLYIKKFIPTILITVILLLNFGFYLYTYHAGYLIKSSKDFNYGYKEALITAKPISKRRLKTVISNSFDHPYIYTTWYWGIKPYDYHSGGLANVEFKPIDSNALRPQTLYIANPSEINPTDPRVIFVVNDPFNKPIFVLADMP